MKTFIDGDTIAYAAAVSGYKSVDGTDDPVMAVQVTLGRVKRSLDHIIEATQASEYKLYLSDDTVNTFRKAFYSDYKNNRPKEKPPLLEAARDYMKHVWGAQVWPGLEADDAVAIEQTRVQHTGCIAAIDKDLLQVPGLVYNWRSGTTVLVTEREGADSLYRQSLMGDKTDNIPGLGYCGVSTIQKHSLTSHAKRGCGEVSARKILEGATDELEMYERVRDAYEDTYGSEWKYRLVEQMNLVYLIREFNGGPVLWTPPQ